MAGLNADLEDFRAWLAEGIEASGLQLKTQSGTDAKGHSYALRTPQVFLHAYPNFGAPTANLPSVLVTLDVAKWADDKMTADMTLTLGVWDSGVHNEDVFEPVPGEIGYERQAEKSYVKALSATTDLLTFVDVVARHLRRNGRDIGLDASNLQFSVVDDEELMVGGIRFATASVSCDFWAAPQASRSSEEQAEDDSAPSFESLL